MCVIFNWFVVCIDDYCFIVWQGVVDGQYMMFGCQWQWIVDCLFEVENGCFCWFVKVYDFGVWSSVLLGCDCVFWKLFVVEYCKVYVIQVFWLECFYLMQYVGE